MLELDYTNVMDHAVGAEGISRDELTSGEGLWEPLVTRVESRRASGKLGFADLPFHERPVAEVTAFAREHSFRNILVLGIGGSALGPAALESALAMPNSGKRLVVLDNIDPDFIRDSLDTLDPAQTFVNVIAKSGVTAETMATFAIVRQWMVDVLGASRVRDHFAVTTDPTKGDLLAIARQEKLPIFAIPENVGGRFSVLSPVGTLPAALLGFNIEALMAGAQRTALQSRKPFAENPALVGAVVQWLLDRKRKKSILVLFPYAQALWKFAFWFKQLWGESLGKKFDRQGNVIHCGQTPTAALGVTDQHSQLQLFIEGPHDKSFLFWGVRAFRETLAIEHPYNGFDSMAYLQGKTMSELFNAERRATEIALTEAGRPNSTVYVDKVDEAGLGSLIVFSEYMTAYAGELYDIDAFDQPGVEYGKKLTFCMMGRSGFEEFRGKMNESGKKERAIVR
jgi:glucose-6-phosphate isomerase